jgi:hypothetical protein
MTNISNVHTLSTSIVDLIMALIILMNIELVELSSDMMRGCINIPVCVYSIGTFGLLWWWWCIIIITIAPPAISCRVSFLFANMIVDPILPRGCYMIFFTPSGAGLEDAAGLGAAAAGAAGVMEGDMVVVAEDRREGYMVVVVVGMGCMGADMAGVHMVGHMEVEHMVVAMVYRWVVVVHRKAGDGAEHMASAAGGGGPAVEVVGETALLQNKGLGAAPLR